MRAKRKVSQQNKQTIGLGYAMLASAAAKAWRELILGYAPSRRPLRILDANCGSGLIALSLSLDGNLVSGVDENPENIERAKAARVPEVAEPDFFTSEAVCFRDGTFDLVLAREYIGEAAEPTNLLSELKRLLKPNGRLLLFESKCLKGEREGSVFPDCLCELLFRSGFKEADASKLTEMELFSEAERTYYASSPLYVVSALSCADEREEDETVSRYYQLKRTSRSDRTIKDLHSYKRKAWGDMLLRYAPKRKRALRVLDVGCGSGFLSITAAKCGWEVTGVDISNVKISAAIENAENMQASVSFICAEADELPFDSEQFDLVISRNVLWNLPNPERAYAEWYRVLGKSGRIVYFDGEWQKQPMGEEAEYFDFARRQAREKNVSGYFDEEVFSAQADSLVLARNYLYDKKRPEWDRQMLPKWGLVPLAIRCDVSDSLWDDYERGLYFMTPLFVVVAEKMKRPTI